MFLFTIKKFAPVTISGYHTTVVNSLETSISCHLPDEHVITSLISQFKVEHPPFWPPHSQLGLSLGLAHSSPRSLQTTVKGPSLGCDF